MRGYRNDLKSNGQTSPSRLSDYAIEHLRDTSYPASLVDIGCGSGEQMAKIISAIGNKNISRCVGVDWSPVAVLVAKRKGIYDDVICVQANRLPFADKEFDIALSIENLEHLYVNSVIPAITEFCRIAHNVMIITPLPGDVINLNWLESEISQAVDDNDPISKEEYTILESAVHKSTVYSESMINAGFTWKRKHHGCYYAKSNDIDISKIKCIGIEDTEITETTDFGAKYLQLLHKSKNLRDKI